jgi:integrase
MSYLQWFRHCWILLDVEPHGEFYGEHMASLRKKNRCKVWFARFYGVDGRLQELSTGTRNEREAERIALAFEDAARRRRTLKVTRDAIERLHGDLTGEVVESQTLKHYCEGWLVRKRGEGIKPSSFTFYSTAIAKFLAFLGDRLSAPMTSITRREVEAFRDHEARTLSAKTVGHHLKCLRMMFRGALEDRVISESPCEFMKATRAAQMTTKPIFTIEQLRAVFSLADAEWRSLMLFSLGTGGQRLGDMAALTWRNVDLPKREVRFISQKTNRAINRPLVGQLLEHVESLQTNNEPSAPIHPRAYAIWNRTGRTGILSGQFVSLLVQAGLRTKKSHKKEPGGKGHGAGSGSGGLSFHCLRHTVITWGEQLGISKSTMMELAGHDSEAMSHHYTHVGREALERAVASLPTL